MKIITNEASKYPIARCALSEDDLYRYWLHYVWDKSKPLMIFAMLNPSWADAFKPDPTATRCVDFAARHDCGGIVILNMYAYRTEKPSVLKRAGWLVGIENDAAWQGWLATGAKVVCAWGATLAVDDPQIVKFKKMAADYKVTLYHLGLTDKGQPRHPLYLPSTTKIQPLEERL